VLAPVPQQKTLKMLTGSAHDLSHDTPQTDQIAHGFVIGIRDPDGRQFAGSVKTR
jgi:hypothetical protein